MKPMMIAAFCLAILCAPARAAEPAMPSAGPDTITFTQYRDWRNDFIARRQGQIISQLAERGLSEADHDRLTREKAYYDRQAAMSGDERDRMFRARFNQIDTNRDGTIDRAERTAWHDRQQARYRHDAAATASRR